MAGPTIVQSRSAAAASGVGSLAFASPTARNNAIVVIINGVGIGTGAVGDTSGNSFTNNTATSASGNFQSSLSYATRIKGGIDTVTFNLAAAGRVTILEIGPDTPGMAPTVAFTQGGNGTTANPAFSAGGTSLSNTLVIAGFTGNGSGAPSAGIGWSPIDATLISSGVVDLIEDQTFAAPGSLVTVTGTGVGGLSPQWAVETIAFFSIPFGTSFAGPRESLITNAGDLSVAESAHGLYSIASSTAAVDDHGSTSMFIDCGPSFIPATLKILTHFSSNATGALIAHPSASVAAHVVMGAVGAMTAHLGATVPTHFTSNATAALIAHITSTTTFVATPQVGGGKSWGFGQLEALRDAFKSKMGDDFDEEFGISPALIPVGKYISFDLFEARALKIVEEQARSDQLASYGLAMMRREAERREKIVKVVTVTVTIAGIAYAVSRVLLWL